MMFMTVGRLAINIPKINAVISKLFRLTKKNKKIKRIVWAIFLVSEKSSNKELFKVEKNSTKSKNKQKVFMYASLKILIILFFFGIKISKNRSAIINIFTEAFA